MIAYTLILHCLACRHSTEHVLRHDDQGIATELECTQCGRKFIDQTAGAQ